MAAKYFIKSIYLSISIYISRLRYYRRNIDGINLRNTLYILTSPIFTLLSAFWTKWNLICKWVTQLPSLQKKFDTTKDSYCEQQFEVVSRCLIQIKRLALAVTLSQFDICQQKFRYDYRRFPTRPVAYVLPGTPER